MKTVETTVSVRYAETDQMGVVYYANYYVWFEVGRNAYFNKRGPSIVELEKEGVYFPVIESHCRYRHPAHYGEEILIKTYVTAMKPTRVRISYEILRQKDNYLLAEGYTEHAFMSNQGKPLNISKSHPQIWEKLQRAITS